MVQLDWWRIFNVFAASGILGSLWVGVSAAVAQITPDATLAGERSILVPNVLTERGIVDRIDGGAIRGSNLFHSFSDFNVNTGQRVYFANPASIANIISRVTGRNVSGINGTLGVLGNANLFLINPNGIVFGPGARLDIRGSFSASTADRLLFQDGYAFSATNPEAPPLLTVNAPLGLASWLPSSGSITNNGTLSTGQDLTLVGRDLNLQGQLRAGRDLNLVASNALIARDSATSAFVASAGNNLLMQGNQSLDIAALNHPESGLVAGKDMVLRSNNAIITDTYFTAGGNFRAEKLDGSPANIVSIDDPVFEVAGDFTIAAYTGASLQILAGGSVTIPGAIIINAAGGPFNDGTVVLSNGTPLAVSGTTQPTLDIRAGTTGFFGTPTAGTPTSANITIGSVTNPGGLVLLTNQYQPNRALTGGIQVGTITTASPVGGGTVVLDSRGGITFNSIDSSGAPTGNAGDVTLLARGNIFMPLPSFIFADGLRGGNITLRSDSAIIQESAPRGTDPLALSTIQSLTLGAVKGGDVRLTAPLISIGGNVVTVTDGEGQGGFLFLTADTLTTNAATVATLTYGPAPSGEVFVVANSIALGTFSFLGSASFSGSGGRGGDVSVQAGSLTAIDGAQMGSFTFGIGDAGNVRVTAQTIELANFLPADLAAGLFSPSAIFSSSQPGAEGNSGNISITTGSLTLTGAASVSTSAYTVGNAGDIAIQASRFIRVDGAVFTGPEISNDVEPSGISSEVFRGAIGRGGNINITTPLLAVTNGGTITATSNGTGDAGSINIVATEGATFDGVVSFASIGQRDRISRAAVIAGKDIVGNGGSLTITTPVLSLLNGGQLTAQTDGNGNAGNIKLNISDTLLLDGAGSGVLANTAIGSTGNGGSIIIDPDVVRIRNGAGIAVDSKGTGTAGNITVLANSLALTNNGFISAETFSNTGGNIFLFIRDVLAMRNNSRISTSAGTVGAGGDGGNITINTNFLVTAPNENNDITANAFTGRGGRVDITAQGIFGFQVLSRIQLEAALGTSDPTLLNPAFLPTSDITAISQVNPNLNGVVVIQSPNPDPSRGALPLPPELVDASRLIAQDCSAGSTIGRQLGSLVVTGQGGLPPSPTDQLRGDSLLIGWENVNGTSRNAQPSAAAPLQERSPVQLVEVQALEKRSDGRVVLVAHNTPGSNQEFWNRPATCPTLNP